MFKLLPRDTTFFDLFEKMGNHTQIVAAELATFVDSFPIASESLHRIREIEHAADGLAHQALERLDKTFITPFDREDIHTLVGELDDIVDGVDALAKRFDLFHVKAIDPIFIKQTRVLVKATTILADSVGKLRKSRKLCDLSPLLISIHEQESLGDDNHHEAISKLFDGTHDPLEVMKWKELFDLVEDAIDGCEDVGNTLERIVLKNG